VYELVLSREDHHKFIIQRVIYHNLLTYDEMIKCSHVIDMPAEDLTSNLPCKTQMF